MWQCYTCYKLTQFKYCTVSGFSLFEKSRWWEPPTVTSLKITEVTSWWYSQWWRFRQYCTFPISWVRIFFLIFCIFWTRIARFCPGKQYIALLLLLHDWDHYWTSPHFRLDEDLKVFGVGGDLSWHPTPSVGVLSVLYRSYRTFSWSNFKSGYFTGLLTGHFFCQESLEIWSLSLAVRSRSFYRRTGTESDIREERKSDAAKGDVASSSSLYTNTDRFLPFS